jgi:hypothetical protein
MNKLFGLPALALITVFSPLLGNAQSPPIPAQQQKFISIIDDFAAKFKTAPNDMAKGALRPKRAEAICELITNPEVTDWVGTVQKLSSNREGKGILEVSISKSVNANTWNNALSDIGDKTLIEPGTALHEAAIQLKPKQAIIFSGTFIKSDKDCLRESSMTQNGSMTKPNWIFRFSSVRPAQ